MGRKVECVACGCREKSKKMDMTGLGFRCNRCTLAAAVEAYSVGSDLQFHHTPGELDKIAARAQKEAWLGVLLFIIGTIWLVGEMYLVGHLGRWPLGLMTGGVAMWIHGRWLRRKARIGIEQWALQEPSTKPIPPESPDFWASAE